jgi:hypothetical protein
LPEAFLVYCSSFEVDLERSADWNQLNLGRIKMTRYKTPSKDKTRDDAKGHFANT